MKKIIVLSAAAAAVVVAGGVTAAIALTSGGDAPACSAVWVAGEKLPSEFDGECSAGGEVKEWRVTQCPTDSRITLVEDPTHSFGAMWSEEMGSSEIYATTSAEDKAFWLGIYGKCTGEL